MKTLLRTAVCLLVACRAAAGGIEIAKDAVTVYPPDPQGAAVIAGPPGCVAGFPPLYVTARNRNSGAAVNAAVSADGSFSLKLPAGPGDSVKLTFYARSGKDKDMTVRIPGEGDGQGAGVPGHERAEVNVDLSPFARFGAPEVVQVKPDGRGGTRVHVGRRPQTPIPAPVPPGTPSPAASPLPGVEGTPVPISSPAAGG